MSWRNVPFLKEAVLIAAACLPMAPRVLAGDVYHAPRRSTTPSRPEPAPVVRVLPRPVTLAVVLPTSPQAAPEPVYVYLRGPDGSMRLFPMEGGRDAIWSPQVVLRPGESLTIRWIIRSMAVK